MSRQYPSISEIEKSEAESDHKRRHNRHDTHSDKYRDTHSSRSTRESESSSKDKYKRMCVKLSNKLEEVEKRLEYVKQQINIVTSERNMLYDELQSTKSSLTKEKQKVVKEYENKLLSHKEVMDERYDSKTNMIKKLESTIQELQKKLNEYQLDENNNRKIAEQHFRQKEKDIEIQNQKILEANESLNLEIERKNQEIQTLKKRMETSIQQSVLQSKQNLEMESKKILLEKEGEIDSLTKKISELEHRMKQEKFLAEQMVKKVVQEKEREKAFSEKKLEAFQTYHSTSVSEVKKAYDRELDEKITKLKKEAEDRYNNSTKEFADYKIVVEKEIENMKAMFASRLEEANKCIVNAETERDIFKEKLNKVNTENNIEKEIYIKKAITTTEKEYKSLYDVKCKELSDLKLLYEKSLGESEETIQRLREKVLLTDINMKKLQDNTHNLNSQFLSNMAKQKETLEAEIKNREKKIETMSAQMQALANESVEKITMLENSLNSTKGQLEDTNVKYETVKMQNKSYSDSLSSYQSELSRKSDLLEQVINQNNKLIEDLKTAERMASLAENDKKSTEIENNKYKTKVTHLTQTINRQKNELLRLEDEVFRLKEEIDQTRNLTAKTSFSLRTEQERNETLQKNLQNLENKLRIAETSIERKNNEISSLKNSISILENNLALQKSENEQSKLRVISDFKKSEEIKLAEKEQNISSLKKELAIEMEKFQNIINEINEKEKEILRLKTDKSKLEIELEKLNKNLSENISKKQENISLKKEIQNLRDDYNREINLLKKKHEEERKEFNQAVNQLSYYKNQEQRVNELQKLLSTIREDYEKNSAVKDQKHSEELKKLTERLKSAEDDLIKTDQLVEKVKLEYLKKLADAKAIEPEEKKKLESVIRERDMLLSQLQDTKEKLENVQYEFLSASAALKVRTEQLSSKEAELRRKEAEIAAAPPKILDPTLRQGRDAALESLRKIKVEMAEIKEKNMNLVQKLHVAENLVKELNEQKKMIQESQSDLKKTFVQNLNQQQTNHEKELEKRDNRIKELEEILTKKLNN